MDGEFYRCPLAGCRGRLKVDPAKSMKGPINKHERTKMHRRVLAASDLATMIRNGVVPPMEGTKEGSVGPRFRDTLAKAG